jgi:putative MATE family efflux protein
MFGKSIDLIREKQFYKSFFSLAAVIAAQNIIIFSVNLADSLMLGKYSENALSGVALVNQIQFLLQMLVMGIADGALVFGARAYGEKDMDTVRKITNISVKAGLAVSFLLGVIVYLFPVQALSILSNDAAIVAEGAKYLKIVCFTYPVFALTNTLLTSLRSVEEVKIGFYVSLSALFSNIILNYIMIFGKLGFKRMGAEGAAIATLISRIIELIFVITYLGLKDKKIGLKLHDFRKMDRDLFKAFVKTGIPVFGSNAIWGIAMAVQTAILGHMGEGTITANSIASTLFQLMSVMTYGSANATAVLISKTIGEGKIEKIRPYTKTLQFLFLMIGLVTGSLLLIFRNTVVDWYLISEGSAQLSKAFITVLAVTAVGTSYEMPCLTGIVRAGGDTSFVLKNDFIFMWLIVIPAALLAAFVFQASPVAVFAILKSDQITKCFVALVKVNRYKWIRNIRP